MPNIIDILARALSLRQETELNSITPNRAGGIMYDTLLVLNQMQLDGGALLISKVYASVSAMEADTTPTSDLTGRALKPGQLVVIVTTNSSSSDMGSEYRFNGPGSWTYVGKVGGLPLDTVPIQSSTKGITSGGVYNSLAALKNEGYKYMGVATPGSGGTAPGTPNQPVFYIAGPGSYPNFGSITVASGYLGFIKYSGGSWSVESVAVGKDYDQEISQLQQELDEKIDRELDDNTLYITDASRNIIARIDADGVSTIDVKVKIDGELVSVKSLLSTFSGSVATERARAEAEEAKKLDHTLADNKFIITDADGNIIVKVDKDGIHSAMSKHAVACMVFGEYYYPTSAPTRDENGNVTHAEVMFGTGVAGSVDITYSGVNAVQVLAHYGDYTYTVTIQRDENGNVEVVSVN